MSEPSTRPKFAPLTTLVPHRSVHDGDTTHGSAFYIAPVLPGDEVMIETPPHKDGHGSQSAYHLYLFGDGANRVFFWKPVLDKTAQQLHRALPIPAKPNLPHNVTGYSFSSSQDDWERKVTADRPLKEAGHAK